MSLQQGLGALASPFSSLAPPLAVGPLLKPKKYDAVVAADTPRFWWKLGDAVGSGTAADSADTRPMTLIGTGTAFGVTGIPGSVHTACSFTGHGGFNDNAAAFSLTSPFSLEHWIKTTSNPAVNHRQAVLAFYSFPNVVAAVDGNGGAIEANMGTINIGYLTGFGTVEDGNWHHVVETYNGTTQILYIDGANKASQAVGYTPFSSTFSIANTLVGGQNWDYYIGTAAHAAVYSVALSAARILAHYKAGLNL